MKVYSLISTKIALVSSTLGDQGKSSSISSSITSFSAFSSFSLSAYAPDLSAGRLGLVLVGMFFSSWISVGISTSSKSSSPILSALERSVFYFLETVLDLSSFLSFSAVTSVALCLWLFLNCFGPLGFFISYLSFSCSKEVSARDFDILFACSLKLPSLPSRSLPEPSMSLWFSPNG